MVKNIVGIVVSFLLLLLLSYGQLFFVAQKFDAFQKELDGLFVKTENATATIEDGKAVRLSWEKSKTGLQILVPHNDISQIDFLLNETLGLLYTEEYTLAIPKIVVLQELCKSIPELYSPKTENIF